MSKKLKEHYRIDVPISASRNITQQHGAGLLLRQEPVSDLSRGGVEKLIAEMDGTSVPIVKIAEESGENPIKDRRKLRQVGWREARLCLARRPESVRAYYRASLGGVEEAGEHLQHCVVAAGGGKATRLHCVGDAAGWIINQVEKRFGEQASYLIDYYHLSEYLSSAGEQICQQEKAGWVKQQQEKMKANRVAEVIDELKREVEQRQSAGGDEAVVICERYISNHEQYFDYQGAIEQGLPIGSGEVEGGHRWVIQKRLKLSGAWWREENAEKMLALRAARANDEWQSYWEDVRQAAA